LIQNLSQIFRNFTHTSFTPKNIDASP